MATATTKYGYGNLFRITKVARAFRVSTARIRQVSAESDIGTRQYGPRLFNAKDIQRLEKIFGRVARFR